jgi:predicted DNA-binding transcriptional regulator YafY
MERMERVLKVLDLVEGAREGLTVREIHQRLKEEGVVVIERTVQRDLEVLEAAGFPLFDEESGRASSGGCRGPRRWRVLPRSRGRSWVPVVAGRRGRAGHLP